MKYLIFIFLLISHTAFAQNRSIKRDTTGSWRVKLFQQALVNKGYKLTIDGRMGSKTRKALYDWNAVIGLPVFPHAKADFLKSLGLPLDLLNN